MKRPGVTFSNLFEEARPNWLGTNITDPKVTLQGGIRIDPTGITPQADGRIFVPSGTVLGRTYAERDAGAGMGFAAAGDQQLCILLHDVWDLREGTTQIDVVIGMSGNTIYHNFLPGWAGLAAAVKALVYANFITVVGQV